MKKIVWAVLIAVGVLLASRAAHGGEAAFVHPMVSV